MPANKLRAAVVLNYERSLVLEVLFTKASDATDCTELAMSLEEYYGASVSASSEPLEFSGVAASIWLQSVASNNYYCSCEARMMQ